ncbi:MAG: metallophosphoesterase family protein [Deltaproteobacteria bacterium]|nr:metallophosphoesterase family protein [Deltaproteobacteria bacterium]
MKIGVISDTHLNGYDRRLKKIFDEYFFDCDMILHAGDLVSADVLEAFRVKDVKAVHGNMDYLSVKQALPDRLVLEIDGFKIGLIHGWGAPYDIEERLLKTVGPVDCLVYGHTHQAVNEVKNGILFFNPGSAMDKRFASHRTIGILTTSKEITGEIIELGDE